MRCDCGPSPTLCSSRTNGSHLQHQEEPIVYYYGDHSPPKVTDATKSDIHPTFGVSELDQGKLSAIIPAQPSLVVTFLLQLFFSFPVPVRSVFPILPLSSTHPPKSSHLTFRRLFFSFYIWHLILP